MRVKLKFTQRTKEKPIEPEVKPKSYEDETDDTPHEGVVGSIQQLDNKPVKVKRRKIGFY